MKKRRRFKNQDQEREYWSRHDSTAEVDWSKARRMVLPDLNPSIKTISLRLPESMLDASKLLANRHDVPYQSRMKVFLAERIKRELGGDAA